MTPFDRIQIFQATVAQVGNSAMWDAALRILPGEDTDRNSPVVVNVIDGKGNQICITRINGMPTLIAASLPQRLSDAAMNFQARWQATPAENQIVTQCQV